jgi:purine catabolism regulator
MVDGGGIPDVLALLAAAVANPVFLEAADGRLLHHAAGPSGGDPIGVWTQAASGAEGVGAVAPVAGGGRLVALPVDAPLDAFAPAAVERAAGIVALALLRTRQEEELLARGRGDLLAELMAGRLAGEEAAARARALGFAQRAAGALLPVVARGGDARAIEGLGLPALVGAGAGVDPARETLLMVLALRDADDRAATADRVAQALGPDAVVAVAGAVGGRAWDAVGVGLREAAESAAAVAGSARPAPRTPRRWHDTTAMALDRLLWRRRDGPELAEYVERTLGPVIAHDARRKHALLPTLEALCANGGRKAETARALHLNRQALYDRLKRLEDVLGRDVSDPRVLLELQLAVEARRHLSSD